MSLRYKHVSASEGIQQLLAELWNGDEPLKARKLVLHVLSNKWFHLIDPGFDPLRFVLVRSCNDFTFGYTTSGSDPALDHHVEVVLDHKNELQFLENGSLLTSRELITRMIESMATQ